ncbi:hypothetical protein B0H15DRAFT_1023300 [Mycena belliarum]|uniref:Uncharacterized protein n=1 Tax=Mycena belliarum TaxID=1033014 RepID=A0AAD6U5M7_9AGAR|nr:hypothetical protein B0H15DRAFT_1023300 [Mycena belliae]
MHLLLSYHHHHHLCPLSFSATLALAFGRLPILHLDAAHQVASPSARYARHGPPQDHHLSASRSTSPFVVTRFHLPPAPTSCSKPSSVDTATPIAHYAASFTSFSTPSSIETVTLQSIAFVGRQLPPVPRTGHLPLPTHRPAIPRSTRPCRRRLRRVDNREETLTGSAGLSRTDRPPPADNPPPQHPEADSPSRRRPPCPPQLGPHPKTSRRAPAVLQDGCTAQGWIDLGPGHLFPDTSSPRHPYAILALPTEDDDDDDHHLSPSPPPPTPLPKGPQHEDQDARAIWDASDSRAVVCGRYDSDRRWLAGGRISTREASSEQLSDRSRFWFDW